MTRYYPLALLLNPHIYIIILVTEKVQPALTRREITHERILKVAARVIRRSGCDGTGAAHIMKEAGLTHQGFYAQFASREAMLAKSADRAGAESVARLTKVASAAPGNQAMESLIRTSQWRMWNALTQAARSPPLARKCHGRHPKLALRRRVALRRWLISSLASLPIRASTNWVLLA